MEGPHLSSILIQVSLINHPAIGVPLCGNPNGADHSGKDRARLQRLNRLVSKVDQVRARVCTIRDRVRVTRKSMVNLGFTLREITLICLILRLKKAMSWVV